MTMLISSFRAIHRLFRFKGNGSSRRFIDYYSHLITINNKNTKARMAKLKSFVKKLTGFQERESLTSEL